MSQDRVPQELVLVIEDDESNRGIVGMVLDDAGFQSILAADLAEAQVLARGQPIGLVLTDYLQAARLRATETYWPALEAAWPGVPIVVCTGFAPSELRIPAGGAVVEIVPKPYDIDQLLRAVEQALGKPGAADSAST